MQSCLDELKREFRKFGNIDHKILGEEVLVIQTALLKSFKSKLREQVGNVEFNFIGYKTKALLQNIEEIKMLLQTLINRCCVQFYV